MLKTVERLAVLETKSNYIQNSINNLERGLIQRDEILQKELNELKGEFQLFRGHCEKMQDRKVGSLTGKDKAVVYASACTALASIVASVLIFVSSCF